VSPCGTTSHTYCELFCALADPEPEAREDGVPDDAPEGGEAKSPSAVEGLSMPGRLSYSANHLWCDLGADAVFHIGMDAFAAKVFGSAERLSFITQTGLHYPTALLTVKGVDLQFVFPHQVMVTKTNAYLRTNPGKLFSHPYSLGWLFEGINPRFPESHTDVSPPQGLAKGAAAIGWMKEECKRMTALAHEFNSRPDRAGRVSMADGGTFAPGILQELSRDEVHRVFNEFFSPFLHRRPVP
jgi:glycine cleavage system H lipoate-binding protein